MSYVITDDQFTAALRCLDLLGNTNSRKAKERAVARAEILKIMSGLEPYVGPGYAVEFYSGTKSNLEVERVAVVESLVKLAEIVNLSPYSVAPYICKARKKGDEYVYFAKAKARLRVGTAGRRS